MKLLSIKEPSMTRKDIKHLMEIEGTKIKKAAYANGKQLGLQDPPRPASHGDKLLPFILDIKTMCERVALTVLKEFKPALNAPIGTIEATWADMHHKRLGGQANALNKRANLLELELTGFHPEAIAKNKLKAKIIIGFLFLGEIALNSMAFQVFGDSALSSMIIAAFISLLIAFAAHTSGRQYIEANTKHKRRLVLILSSLFALSFAVAITSLRETFLNKLGFNANPWIFILCNIAVFAGAAFASYYYYPTKREDEENRENLQKYHELKNLQKQKGQKINEQVEHELKSKATLGQHMEAIVDSEYAMALIEALFQEAVSEFMRANMNCRSDTPSCFSDPIPTLNIPIINFHSSITKYKTPNHENNNNDFN